MEKIYKTKEVLREQRQREPIFYKDIKNFKFEDDDIILSGYREAEEYSDSSHEGYYYFYVKREVIETDREFEERVESTKIEKERLIKNRYERYLQLKKEFEQ
jgi:hypothetical protein